MAAVTISGMLAAEAAAIAMGWTEERLLDLAGKRLGLAIGRFFPHPGTVIGYLGKGHNAGDTLVALKVLRDQFGWKIATRNAFPIEQCAALTLAKWRELGPHPSLERVPEWREMTGPLVLLDGLLGSGAAGALRPPLLPLADEMRWLRQQTGARIAAIDLPSGVDADSGVVLPGAVVADVTFMIGNAKRGLLTGTAANATGALALVPVEPLTFAETGDMELVSPQTMEFAKSPRPFDFHKGMAGRVGIVAGSTRYPGAAALAAIGALRGGAGLITLHAPEPAVAMIQSRCPPEIIVRAFTSPTEIQTTGYDSWVIGCGLGEYESGFGEALLEWLANISAPTVLDASALNLIALGNHADVLRENQVITPHPGEFKRLAPDLAELSRESAAREFAHRIPATLLLKGARTIVTHRGQALWCNSTGSPGMSTGGQGDLLAGVIGARLAIGDGLPEAAALSAWLCGRAAEITLEKSEFSEESLIPSDVARFLGAAFLDWKSSRR